MDLIISCVQRTMKMNEDKMNVGIQIWKNKQGFYKKKKKERISNHY